MAEPPDQASPDRPEGGSPGVQTAQPTQPSQAVLEFEGQRHPLPKDRPFVIGREGDLVVDDNRYLHRRLIQIEFESGFWWLANVGSRIAATISDPASGMQAWLPPGTRLPLTFANTSVVFTAGPCTYTLTIWTDTPIWRDWTGQRSVNGVTTQGAISLTASQRLLIVALAEAMLRHRTGSAAQLTSNADAARRLGWTLTRFNRKLDNVCDKLDRLGVDGVRGGPGDLATGRRARLVEYAVSTGLVTPVDLQLLDQPAAAVAAGAGTAGDN